MSNQITNLGTAPVSDESLGVLLPTYTIKKRDGSTQALDDKKILATLFRAGALEEKISLKTVLRESFKNLFDGATSANVEVALILAASTFIERDSGYNLVAAKLFREKIYKEASQVSTNGKDFTAAARQTFKDGLNLGLEKGYLDDRLKAFDFEKLAGALDFERDHLLDYIGIQTLYERYFLKDGKRILETPQAFWMRAAMVLAILEENKD